jgi:TPR repeat protein
VEAWADDERPGNLNAAALVAIALEDGTHGVERDLELALVYYQRAMRTQAGRFCMKGRASGLAAEMLANQYPHFEARVCDPSATSSDWLSLAKAYNFALGVEFNESRAIACARRALELAPGDSDAAVFLAECLISSINVGLIAEGVRLLGAAADRGDVDAMWTMALLLVEGKHIKRDNARAVCYLHEAAAAGSGDACRELAGWFLEGVGVAQQCSRSARQWARVAAGRGFSSALLLLGRFAADDNDHAAAVRHFASATALGSTAAAAELARCYRKGLGVVRDADAASRLYAHAVTSRSATAEVRHIVVNECALSPSEWASAMQRATESSRWAPISLTNCHRDIAVALAQRGGGVDAAVEFCRRSARIDILPLVAEHLGNINQFGRAYASLTADSERAVQVIAIARAEGDVSTRAAATLVLGRLKASLAGGSTPEAEGLIAEAAALGNGEAMWRRAIELWRRANGDVAQQRAAMAMNERTIALGGYVAKLAECRLALQLSAGVGGDNPDRARAASLLRDASDTLQSASFFFGCALLDGLGVELDETNGLAFVRTGLGLGFAELQAMSLESMSLESMRPPYAGFAKLAIESGVLEHQPDLLCALLSETGFGRVHNEGEALRRCVRAIEANGIAAPTVANVDLRLWAKFCLIASAATGDAESPLADLTRDSNAYAEGLLQLAHYAQEHQADAAWLCEDLLRKALSARGNPAQFAIAVAESQLAINERRRLVALSTLQPTASHLHVIEQLELLQPCQDELYSLEDDDLQHEADDDDDNDDSSEIKLAKSKSIAAVL